MGMLGEREGERTDALLAASGAMEDLKGVEVTLEAFPGVLNTLGGKPGVILEGVEVIGESFLEEFHVGFLLLEADAAFIWAS